MPGMWKSRMTMDAVCRCRAVPTVCVVAITGKPAASRRSLMRESTASLSSITRMVGFLLLIAPCLLRFDAGGQPLARSVNESDAVTHAQELGAHGGKPHAL